MEGDRNRVSLVAPAVVAVVVVVVVDAVHIAVVADSVALAGYTIVAAVGIQVAGSVPVLAAAAPNAVVAHDALSIPHFSGSVYRCRCPL